MSRTEITERVEILLDPALDPASVTVWGLGLGDPVPRSYREHAVAGHCPDAPRARLRWSSQESYEIQRDGEPALRPYPPAERFDDVCTWGGWVELGLPPSTPAHGTIRFDVAEQRVTDIHLSGPWLHPLGLDSESAIAQELGRNDRYGRSRSRTTWAWPARRYAITWNHEEDRLASISLGPAACQLAPTFDATSLIRLALAWRRSHPQDDWSLSARTHLASERIQAARLAALMRAFGVFGGPAPLERFFSGAFVEGADRGAQAALIAFLAGSEHGQPRLDPTEAPRTHAELRWFWQWMLGFRLHMEAIETFDAGVMAASGLFRHAVDLVRHAAKTLEPDRDHIDHALSLILDPSQRAFCWGYLVRELGFPDDDLDRIEDEEWL